ncbi:MAG TPA: tRNA guanosine(34) transglycosylase Tgt [Candidatus Levybacteria bacterium]|nr:tRNA guanosine(34) transglycosylase Tgt [Candidatus Levybacteria bacterium]
MISFDIVKKSSSSHARAGILKTPHGEIETPTLVGVATQATMKALTWDQVKETRTQVLIENTFHLHLKPGEKIIKKAGGLHTFSNWDRPIMTDSGGFQVFSLGFGMDHGVGKILKEKSSLSISEGQQPQKVKITEDGVEFRSPIDGKKIFIGPNESVKIQEDLGADIINAFDECTSPIANYEYTKKSMEKTHRWAKICLDIKKSNQAMYGIVQGGKFKDLRIDSALTIGKMDFNGIAIGGEFGDNKDTLSEMLSWVIPNIPDEKPRHLLGIGHPDDFIPIIKAGIDTFDCIAPTHYARRGIIFTSTGRINMRKSEMLKDNEPLDKTCPCFVCQQYKRSYLAHLLKAHEITPLTLFSYHNLYFFQSQIIKIREEIKNGKI